MNTIIWVLVVYTHGANWIPTIEFKTQEKCEVAATNLEMAANTRRNMWGGIPKPFCLKVEK